jgi:drug/metabolite transporter (DMT)-like permease
MPVLLVLGCTWGASFLFIKVVVDDTGPLELVLGRMSFGLLAVGLFMVFTRRRPQATPRLILQMSGMAILANVIPFGLIGWGEEHISSGTASILNATVPIFTAAIAAGVLTEERFTAPRALGLMLAFIGVAVLTGEDVLDVTSSSVLGQLAVVGAAACYGFGAVYARILLRGQDPVNLAFLQLALGILFTVPLLLVVTGGSPDLSIQPEAWASVAALGMLGTGFGYIGWLWLIENLGSVRASLVTYIVPVVAVVLGWLVLDESIGVNTVAGGLLIVAGVASAMRGAAPVRVARREPAGAPVAAGR